MKNRKPLLTPEEAAYIAGAAPSATAAPTTAPVPAEKLVRFTVDLPVALHRRLKVAAMDRGEPMTGAAREAITAWLDSLNN
jgi:hypothetical protein